MFTNGYTEKRALQDALQWMAYRVHNPGAEVTAELIEAETRLQDLNSGELLEVIGAALSCGIRPGIARPGSTVKDPSEGRRGRF